jgi:hypothetical protein
LPPEAQSLRLAKQSLLQQAESRIRNRMLVELALKVSEGTLQEFPR